MSRCTAASGGLKVRRRKTKFGEGIPGTVTVKSIRAIVRATLGVCVSVAIVFAFGEVLARSLNIVDRLNGTPRKLYQRTEHPALPYRLRPGARVDLQKYSVSVNRFGLRGQDVAATRAPGERRLLVLGDSVVFGASVADEETFPVKLQEALMARNGWRGAVLNGGVPGYNVAAEAAFLESIGWDLDPDGIVLGVSLNDFGETPRLNAFGVMTQRARAGSPGWLERHSEFYLLMRWLWDYGRGRHWFQAMSAVPASERAEKFAALNGIVEKLQRGFYDSPPAPRWRRVGRALAAVRDQTRAHDVPFTVVLFPEKFQFGEPAYREPQRLWLELCDELDISCFDLWPAFERALRVDQDLFFDAQHPNAAGLAVAASAVADHLR